MIGPAWIGIDPGAGGGIAAIDLSGVPLATHKMPETEQDILEVFRGFAAGSRAIIERVGASPQMGTVSAFKFGRGVGGLLMALAAAGIPFDEVGSSKWQKYLNCQSGGDKNVTKRRAQSLFPQITVTHALADALLLAEYGRRRSLGVASEFTGVDVTRPKHRLTQRREATLFDGHGEGR